MADFTLVLEGRGRLPIEYVFDESEPANLEELLAAPSPSDVPYQCLLIRSERAVVLVDTGIGSVEHPFGGSGGALVSELERLGVRPENVNVVIVTHGHIDHIGGNVRGGAPTFPRARYVMSKTDWEHWTSAETLGGTGIGAVVAREHLPPLASAGVLDLVDAAEEEGGLTRDPGHRRSWTHRRPPRRRGGRGASLPHGRLLHPVQALRPDRGHGLDEDARAATASLRALLGRAAEHGVPVACSHIEGVFRIERDADAFRLTRA